MGLGKTFKKIVKQGIAPLSGFGIVDALSGPGPQVPYGDPTSDYQQFLSLAAEEEKKRQELGKKQQEQILGFAGDVEGKARDFRSRLAESLAGTARSTFERANPFVLEDLNSRGLLTSQTARDTEQGRLLGDLAREQQDQLSAFDKDIFNQLNDIRGQGLSALLGGDQSALDSALALRKAGLQRTFDVTDTNREQGFAKQLAKRQSRDNLLSGILGGGARIFSAGLGG